MTQTTGYAEALIALGQHMQQNEELSVRSISWLFWPQDDRDAPHVKGLEINCSRGSEVLARWAATLTEVTSLAHRHDDDDGTLFGYVYGRIGDVPVCLWGAFHDDTFPPEPGVHEWDVTVQLQEA